MSSSPIIFVGVADHLRHAEPVAPPVGAVDLFKLSVTKTLLFYPINIGHLEWVCLVKTELLKNGEDIPQIKVIGHNGYEVGWSKIAIRTEAMGELGRQEASAVDEAPSKRSNELIVPVSLPWTMMSFSFNAVVPEPGTYEVLADMGEKKELLAEVEFRYAELPNLSPEQIRAIDSDPNSLSAVRVEMKCNECGEELKTYAALSRLSNAEGDGFVSHEKLPDRFVCSCGKVNWPLHLLRQNLGAVLGREASEKMLGVSFSRRYGHDEIVKVVRSFSKLVDEQDDEGPIQKFIEEHSVMLAQYHAIKILPEQTIIGRYRADFVLLDSHKRLWFLELERPSLRLFKKGGHCHSQLTHAYEQVNDWMEQFRKHRHAVLETMGIRDDEVSSVRGVVIAGRSRELDQEHLQRHLSSEIYPNIEFMTLDDLSRSVLQISRDLA